MAEAGPLTGFWQVWFRYTDPPMQSLTPSADALSCRQISSAAYGGLESSSSDGYGMRFASS